jgi:hypothetical protein
MLLLVIDPKLYMGAISDGLKLFAVSVLPALFPFFFLTKLLTSTGIAEAFSKLTKRPVKFLYGAPDIGGYIFIMSILSGYPVGAKLLSDCYDRGLVNKSEVKSLASFTSTSGPLFVLGTVGSSMLGNYKAGIILLICHYLGALVNGLLYRSAPPEKESLRIIPQNKYDNVLAEAINSSVTGVLAVGGFIAVFNMIIVAINQTGVTSLIVSALPAFPSKLVEGVFSGIIEMTRGALILSSSGENLKTILPLISALIAFGGLSITFQSMTFLSKCGIKPSHYLLTKSSQALLSFAFTAIACSFIF